MLKVEGLEVAYGDAVALREVSIEVPDEAIVALIGSNGAGKTTLVHACVGMLPLRGGRVSVDGTDLQSVPISDAPALGVALVPEGRRLFPQLSVWDNILLGGYHQAVRPHLDEGLAWVTELFPILRKRADQLAGTLSGGEQQMVALARALVSRPKLLLLDEPSLGLAPRMVATLFDAIQEINARGVAVLIAEQNVHRVLEIASYGYVLDTGRIVVEGPAAWLAELPDVRQAYLGA